MHATVGGKFQSFCQRCRGTAFKLLWTSTPPPSILAFGTNMACCIWQSPLPCPSSPCKEFNNSKSFDGLFKNFVQYMFFSLHLGVVLTLWVWNCDPGLVADYSGKTNLPSGTNLPSAPHYTYSSLLTPQDDNWKESPLTIIYIYLHQLFKSPGEKILSWQNCMFCQTWYPSLPIYFNGPIHGISVIL